MVPTRHSTRYGTSVKFSNTVVAPGNFLVLVLVLVVVPIAYRNNSSSSTLVRATIVDTL